MALGSAVVAPLAAASKVFANTGHDLAEMSGIDMETLELGIRRMQRLLLSAAGGEPRRAEIAPVALPAGESPNCFGLK